MNTKVYVTTSLILTLMACGQDEGKTTQSAQSGGAPSGQTGVLDDAAKTISDDEQLAGENISNSVDDAITDVLEGAESRDSATDGFALTNSDKVARLSRFRECKVEDQKAVVTVKRSVEREKTFGKFNRSGSSVLKQLIEKTRTWSKDGGAITCSPNGKHAQIARADLQGVTLVAKYNRDNLQSSTFENTKKNIKVTQSRKVKASGERTVKWVTVKTETDNLLLTKEVRSTASRTFESLNKKGETKSFETTVVTDQALPLIVVHERNKTTDKVISHTIVSGKKIATHKSGTRVETTFSNVKYVEGDGCYASSGKLDGAIYAKDATTASATFTIDFAGESKTIKMTKADGSVVETDYVADGCDFDGQELEETAGIPAEKTAAKDVDLKI
jgi:hypothetical protein